jgi:cytochrome c biogenesis protein CcmG, thiol:disulfide interchange protein DsbE
VQVDEVAGLDGAPELEERPQSRREWSGWVRSLVLPLGLVVAIVGGLLYLQSSGGSDKSDGFGSVALPDAKNPTGHEPSATVERAAPDFVLQALDGSSVQLSDLRGRPLLINFWATWCTSCRSEMPELITAYEANQKTGLVMLAVNLREANDRVRPFVDEYGMPFPVLLDKRGEVARTWRIGGPNQGLPSSYFIDRDGVVRKVVFGAMSAKVINEGLGLITAGSN